MPSKVSRASITLQHYSVFSKICQAGDTKRPGIHRRVAQKPISLRCTTNFYVCVLFNKFCFTPNLLTANSVEMAGFEPATFALQRRCSPTELHPQDSPWVSGLDRIRTCDPCVISTVL